MYTADEVQAAVEKLVQTTVSTPVDRQGSRATAATFTDLQEAAAGVFVLFFDAPFYVASLAARRVAEQVQALQGTLDELVTAALAVNRLVTPVEDLSGLGNASAALGALGDAVAARQQGFSDITKVTAFQRYATNLDNFLDAYGPNVRRGADVVDTPQAARQELAGLFDELVAEQQELRRLVELLAGAIDDFSELRLPQVVAGSVIDRAQQVLADHLDALGAQTPTQRLSSLRGLVLDLLAQRAVVEQYGAALAPSRYLPILGALTPYSDDTHLATPARLPARIPGPYVTVDGQDTVEVALDRAPAYSNFSLPHGVVAELDGRLQEPFAIDATNNFIRYGIETTTSSSTAEVPLTSGLTQTCQNIIDNAAIAPDAALILEQYLYPLKLDTLYNIANIAFTYAQFTITVGPFTPTSFNIQVGDLVLVVDGTNAGTQWTIVNLLADGFTATGAVEAIADTAARVQVGASARALRWRLQDKATALLLRRGIALPTGTDPVQQASQTTIGFFPEMRARSRPVVARDIANYAKFIYPVPVIEVGRLVNFSGFGRTNIADATRLQYFAGMLVGDVDGATPGQITLSNFTVGLGRGPLVGDRLVARGGAGINQEWAVSAVSDTEITATGPTGTTETSVPFDCAPNLSVDFGWYVQVLDGADAGDYPIAEPPGSSLIPNLATTDRLTLALERTLPVPRAGTLAVTFELELAQEVPVFCSTAKTVASEVKIHAGVAAELLFGPIP